MFLFKILVFSCDQSLIVMVGDKKKSGAERFKDYYKRNKASDLFKNKKKDRNNLFQTCLVAKRLGDEDFHRKVKEDQAKRKK